MRSVRGMATVCVGPVSVAPSPVVTPASCSAARSAPVMTTAVTASTSNSVVVGYQWLIPIMTLLKPSVSYRDVISSV